MLHASGRETLLLTQSAGIELLVTQSAEMFGTVTAMRFDNASYALARSLTSWATVIDLAPAGLAQAVAIARAIRHGKSRALILGVATLANEMDSVLSVATAAGFSDVVLMDAGEVETLVRAHLRDDSKRGAYAAAIRCVGRAMPRQHHALACDAIHEASACTSVELLGNRVGSSRWKLDRKLGPIGITASDFVDCCRLVLGGALLEHTDWPVHRVAAEVGYDVRAFRDKTKEIIGCLPSELKGAGATERTGRAVAAKFGICAAHPRIAKERDLPWRRRSH